MQPIFLSISNMHGTHYFTWRRPDTPGLIPYVAREGFPGQFLEDIFDRTLDPIRTGYYSEHYLWEECQLLPRPGTTTKARSFPLLHPWRADRPHAWLTLDEIATLPIHPTAEPVIRDYMAATDPDCYTRLARRLLPAHYEYHPMPSPGLL